MWVIGTFWFLAMAAISTWLYWRARERAERAEERADIAEQHAENLRAMLEEARNYIVDLV